MSRRISPEVRRECVRLRTEDQLSAPAIAKRLKISHHTVYNILEKLPWIPKWPTMHGGPRATWSREEVATLTRLWPIANPDELLTALPARRWANISRKAAALRLRRPSAAVRNNTRPVHPLCRELRAIRLAKGLPRIEVSVIVGWHVNQLHMWELGKTKPDIFAVTDWANGLGYDLVLVRRGAAAVSSIAPLDPKRLTGGRA